MLILGFVYAIFSKELFYKLKLIFYEFKLKFISLLVFFYSKWFDKVFTEVLSAMPKSLTVLTTY